MKRIFATVSLIPSLIWGTVFESDRLEDILPHIEENTWVFLDVDNTLIESSTQLGSAQWRSHVRKKAQMGGFDENMTELVVDHFWGFVQPFISVRLVDPDAGQVVQALKDFNTTVFALTARDPYETSWTQRQLGSVDLSFSSAGLPSSMVLPTIRASLYEDGIIYCGSNAKSDALLSFFDAIGKTPKKVVFVDDKKDQVIKFAAALEKAGIACVCMRFSGADARVEAFNGDVADLQFTLLPMKMEDDEAVELLQEVN